MKGVVSSEPVVPHVFNAETSARHIARYDILGELGHGGMAVVYRARDPRLEREVAVKVLHPHLARDPESRARFEREARAAARLRHLNIVEVYEFDANADDSYLVTELLEGPTLRTHFESVREMPAEVVAAIGAVLCDALGCAHAQGVIHRDVKPDNVMLHRGALKLTDFGIAHVVDAREMTATGQVLGSPAHMSPEQIEGTGVDARTDLFALGTVLYFLATGKLPFEAPTAHGLLKRILDADYADPVRVSPTSGERFGAILRRALSREPGQRFQSASEFKTALLGFMAEAGWEFPDKELQGYFADPKQSREALRARLVTLLPAIGVEARKRGDMPSAMGYFSRALALDPGNPKVVALVRSAARHRQFVRGLRGIGVTVGAALGTAALVLALAPRERIKPPTVLMSTDPDPAAQDLHMARARVTTRSVPAEVPYDSGLAAPPQGPWSASPVRLARPQTPSRVELPPSVAPAGSVARRTVLFIPFERSVMYSVDGGPLQAWDAQHQTLSLSVGPHVFVLAPTRSSERYQRTEWIEHIQAGSGDLLVRHRMNEVTAPRSLVSARDGGDPTL